LLTAGCTILSLVAVKTPCTIQFPFCISFRCPCAVLCCAVLCCASGKENHASSKALKQQQQTPAAAETAARPPPAQQPGYVPCPICSMSIREAFINSHVDSCLEKAGGVAAVQPPPSLPPSGTKPRQQQQQYGRKPPAARSSAGGAAAASNGAAGGSNAGSSGGSGGGGGGGAFGVLRGRAKGSPLDAPPKLCFELLKERDLKAKLTALQLSNDGNKRVSVLGRGGWRGLHWSRLEARGGGGLQEHWVRIDSKHEHRLGSPPLMHTAGSNTKN
jgi:hypothetical protein